MTHICVRKIIIIGSGNGLSPRRRLAIIWTSAWINLSEILIEINTFSFKQMYLNMYSTKWRLFCLGLNELILRIVRDR